MRMMVPRLPGLAGRSTTHDDAVGRARHPLQVGGGDAGDEEQLGRLVAVGEAGEQVRSDLDDVVDRVRWSPSAQRDRSAPSGTSAARTGQPGVEGPVDRLHALDEELAALLALAPVVAQRLEQLELRVLGDLVMRV